MEVASRTRKTWGSGSLRQRPQRTKASASGCFKTRGATPCLEMCTVRRGSCRDPTEDGCAHDCPAWEGAAHTKPRHKLPDALAAPRVLRIRLGCDPGAPIDLVVMQASPLLMPPHNAMYISCHDTITDPAILRGALSQVKQLSRRALMEIRNEGPYADV